MSQPATGAALPPVSIHLVTDKGNCVRCYVVAWGQSRRQNGRIQGRSTGSASNEKPSASGECAGYAAPILGL